MSHPLLIELPEGVPLQLNSRLTAELSQQEFLEASERSWKWIQEGMDPDKALELVTLQMRQQAWWEIRAEPRRAEERAQRLKEKRERVYDDG